MTAIIWVFLFFMFQNAIALVLGHHSLPLVLVVVTYYALGEGPVFGAGLGLFAGFLLDLLGVGKLGLQTGEMGLLGLLSGFFSVNLFRESLLTQTLLPAALTVFLTLVNGAVIRFYFHEDHHFFSWDWLWIAGASPFVFNFLKKVHKRHL